MEQVQLVIEVNGAALDGLYQDLVQLEVEVGDDLMGSFRLELTLRLAHDGSWRYLDQDSFALWMPITIRAGFNGATEELLRGYITHLKPNFETDLTHCTLEVWGLNRSVELDRVEQLKAWPNQRDSDIATTILRDYGLTPQVESTGVTHAEEISTVMQRESDWQFLQRLARRNGYELYVAGDEAYFGPPRLNAPPQPTLAAHFGDQTNLKTVRVCADALAPTAVKIFQVDRLTKEVLGSTVEHSSQKQFGKQGAATLPTGTITPAEMTVQSTMTTGIVEMQTLAQAIYHQAEWFVTVEGEIDAVQYGHLLAPYQPVLIKGIGASFSGLYYTTHVVHTFAPKTYHQRFRAKRSGLGLTGEENFAGGGGGLLGALL